MPSTFPFHLFADSLYRLRVNGRIVGFGPARFMPTHPHHDTYDLSPWLRIGENSIFVEVNSRGAPCFQAVHGKAGFIAWGSDESGGDHGVVLSTPGKWVAHESHAWDRESEPFSFAQGPIEILDARRLPAGYPEFLEGFCESEWSPPRCVENQEHWGPLSPRPIAKASCQAQEPAWIVTANPVLDGHTRYGFNSGNNETGTRLPFFTHVFSPVAQEVEIGSFWGPVFLNGKELKDVRCELRGNRMNIVLPLVRGWNFLYGVPELLQQHWSWVMEVPNGKGIVLRALPDEGCPFHFGLGEATSDSLESLTASAPASFSDLPENPDGWSFVRAEGCSPARELAWDLLGPAWMNNVPFLGGFDLPDVGKTSTVVFDMGGEYLGHACVRFACETDVTVDVGYGEKLGEDSAIAYFQCSAFVNAADRFVCGPGCNEIVSYHERGGRYLQLTFRGQGKPVKIHKVEVLSSTADIPITGSFHCGDAVFDWTWDTGLATLQAGMADGWLDCPWRERGMYVGDVLIQAAVTRKVTTDTRMEPWAIRLWSRAQLPNGQIPCAVPSSNLSPLCDYSLLWIQLLRDYWAATGDVALVKEVWPTVDAVLSSPVWKPGLGGLWEIHKGCPIYVDSEPAPDEKLGVNGVLNAFRIRALECAAELAASIGLGSEEERYRNEGAAVREAFRRILWDEGKNCFAACRIGGNLSEGPALHVNTLALAYGLGDERQETGVLALLCREIPKNTMFGNGFLDLYFLSYLLQSLYRMGETRLAEDTIRSHYKLMKDRGAWTLWEYLRQGLSGQGSLCHSWAASPMIFFSERVLGVRELVAGDPRRILVAPESETLNWASGSVPHPQGTIRVAWCVENNSRLLLALELPEGVHATILPEGRLGGLDLVQIPFSELKLPDGGSPALHPPRCLETAAHA